MHLDANHRRKHRAATGKAMKAGTRHCPSCGRGQQPTRFDVGDGRTGYVCRYCNHEWIASHD